MIPKEKAKQLFDKFYQEAPLDEIEFYNNDVMAKSCALIAVDEILTADMFMMTEEQEKYWEQVKSEILSL